MRLSCVKSLLPTLCEFFETGRKKSEFLLEQKKLRKFQDLGGHLRFPESLLISLDASKEVLAERLDLRVERMKRLGLKKELESYYAKNGEKLRNREHFGVLQCIGLKEFLPYLELSAEQRMSEKGRLLFEKGCEDVKLHTRQYARRQRNWINSRFVRRQESREVPSLKKLDTSDKNGFIAEGLLIVDEWMNGCDFKEKEKGDYERSEEANMTQRCEICDIIIAGKRNWSKHIAGKKHKSVLRSSKPQQKSVLVAMARTEESSTN